ncbi:MAG TPA: TolC family protein [Gemmatimonadaceae bacterium]|nr:TolC family protein [Gemmatimonadaceae bacterium]
MRYIRRRASRRFPSISGTTVGALLATVIALGARAATARAQTSHMSLGDLYREARQASPKVRAAHALARAAAARVPGTKRPPDPELQIGFMNYTLPGLRPMEPLGMTQLQLMQMIPTAGKLHYSGRVASAQAAAEGERATEVEWEVRSEVAMAFYELYKAEQTLAVDRQTLRLLDEIRKVTESMYRVGEGRQADVLRANVEIARMVEDTIRMSTMRTSMVARLNALLDRAADAPVGSPALPEFPDAVPPLDSLIAQASAGRAMVRAGKRELEAAATQSKLARREIWPDLTVGVQVGQQRVTMPAGTDAAGMPIPGERRTERMGSLMIGATLPIFARSRQLRMREEMAAMQRMAEADLAAVRATTRGQVSEAFANLRRARRLAKLYRTTVIPQAEATVESSLAAYRVGSVDFMTLLDNRMSVNEYRQELIALQAEEGTAWAELEMLLGRELMDANSVAADRAAAGGAR